MTMSDLPRSTRIKKEITLLEKDVESLEKQFLDLSNEMTQLTSNNDINNKEVTTSNGLQTGDGQPSNNNDKSINKNEGTNNNNDNVPVDRFAQYKERTPKKWWIKSDVFGSSTSPSNPANTNGAIIPFDLSVNHLQLVKSAPGSPYTDLTVNEDFLPVVLTNDITFRWRSKSRPGSRPRDGEKITAYQIFARRALYSSQNNNDDDDDDSAIILWDSGKVNVHDGMPGVVTYNGTDMVVGSVIEWKVIVWDSSTPNGMASSSDWSKFAVGPSQSEWQGQWISHPIDIESWDETDASAFWTPTNVEGTPQQQKACSNWETRSQLPIFRTKFSALHNAENNNDDEVATALLVVSGLGSFRASIDGKPLSSSGPLDPPLTDFAQRVSYRGFDVTPYLTGEGAKVAHVVGISTGSGMCVYILLTLIISFIALRLQ